MFGQDPLVSARDYPVTTTGEPPFQTARRLNRSKMPTQSKVAADTEEQLFATTFEPLYGPLVRRLTLVLGSEQDAEDVAQETYLRAYRARHQFQGDDPRGWLYTICLRLAFNALRGRRRWIAAIQRGDLVRAGSGEAGPRGRRTRRR